MLHREATLSTCGMKDGEKWGEHTKQLQNLDIGNHVSIQNGHGNSLLKWEKHRIIVSIEGHDKYCIQVDGSRQLTFRNRKHLKKFTPFYMDPDILHNFANNNFATYDDVNIEYPNSPNNDVILPN